MANKWTFLIKSYTIQTAIWAFNIIYKILKAFSIELIPLTYEKVIESLTPEERKETMRPDFSNPLEFFLAGFNRDPQTSGFRRFTALRRARNYAKSRVGVHSEIQRNPDILETPVEEPLVIVGLPRTGTTMLQRMLRNDQQFLSTMLWEMLAPPVPAGRPENWRECARYKFTQNTFKFRELMGVTELSSQHAVGIEFDEECMLILNRYFIDTAETVAMKGMEELRHFNYNCPEEYLENAYEFYKLFLKCMFYKNLDGGKRLLLKAPIHILHLDTYRKVFPNARFVFTYRNVAEITASYCSLLNEIGQQNGYADDPKELGKRVLEFYKHTSAKVVRFFQNFPKESYLVLGYSDIMKDPMAAVKKIYSHFGMKLTTEAENAMKLHMKENPKDKHGKHKYSLADYGITEADLKETFAEFLEYFKDGPEKLL